MWRPSASGFLYRCGCGLWGLLPSTVPSERLSQLVFQLRDNENLLQVWLHSLRGLSPLEQNHLLTMALPATQVVRAALRQDHMPALRSRACRHGAFVGQGRNRIGPELLGTTTVTGEMTGNNHYPCNMCQKPAFQ